FQRYLTPRPLHSFPTRRSSDLTVPGTLSSPSEIGRLSSRPALTPFGSGSEFTGESQAAITANAVSAACLLLRRKNVITWPPGCTRRQRNLRREERQSPAIFTGLRRVKPC